ncbi:quinol dehydrogenase ferredoxin subunit NapH, partial [Campylobacter lari]
MKYLILRRIVQFSILILFSIGACSFILKGNLSSSVLFSTIPLSDPFALMQL